MSEPAIPWYKHNLLPKWFPGWLATSLLIGIGFGVGFGLFLESESPLLTAAVAGLVGFGFALVILTMVAAKHRGNRPNPIAPPAVIRNPILTALLCLMPLFAVMDRAVRWPTRRGHSPVLVDGVPAEAFGLLGLFAIAGCLLLFLWLERRNTGTVRTSVVLSNVIALGILAYALFRVVHFHS